MKRLALMLSALGICATAGACDGSRGLTEPAGRVQNIGTWVRPQGRYGGNGDYAGQRRDERLRSQGRDEGDTR